MCAEKIQRFLMAIVLTLSMGLTALGHVQYGMLLQGFVILMVIVWAIKDFCPSLWVFTKLFGTCPQQ
jgi:hypothetical protein